MYTLYTNNSIIAGPEQEGTDQIFEDIKRSRLVLTVERDLKEFLGVNT